MLAKNLTIKANLPKGRGAKHWA